MSKIILRNEPGDQSEGVRNINEEAVVRTMWRGRGHEAFWCMGGFFALCKEAAGIVGVADQDKGALGVDP